MRANTGKGNPMYKKNKKKGSVSSKGRKSMGKIRKAVAALTKNRPTSNPLAAALEMA